MAARLLGIVTMALSADSASVLIGQLTKPGDKSSKFESNEGHLTAAGYVLAQLLMGMPGLALSCMSILSRRSSDKIVSKGCQCYNALRQPLYQLQHSVHHLGDRKTIDGNSTKF